MFTDQFTFSGKMKVRHEARVKKQPRSLINRTLLIRTTCPTFTFSFIVLTCVLQDVHIPRLITPAEKGRDLEPRVIDAYIIQSQAEAQEGALLSNFIMVCSD